MNSASMNSALETFFEICVMKSAPENFSNFSKKINVQTTDRSVQNFWGLAFGMFSISPILARPRQVCNWQGVTQHNRCAIEAPEEIQVTTISWKLFLLYQLNIIFTCGFLCKGIRLLNLASFPSPLFLAGFWKFFGLWIEICCTTPLPPSRQS